MLKKVLNNIAWTPSYLLKLLEAERLKRSQIHPMHIYLCICDHFEPYWMNTSTKKAMKRINRWINQYPQIADKYRDSDGIPLKYSFFYPQEEYRYDDLKAMEELYYAGFGEIEIHLHHNNDTPDNLRNTLSDYKKRLHEKHGYLSIDKVSHNICYGFIHGNWALDNSRPDGRWCGVNNEIDILSETGCYADFTMPSAPSPTQTKKVNSIYYAIDNPEKPKSHNSGKDVIAGKRGKGLLMVQGPLGLYWKKRKFGFIPKIENGELTHSNPPNHGRMLFWLKKHIHVRGYPNCIFIKLHTHGAQEKNMDMLLTQGYLGSLLSFFNKLANENSQLSVHFVSAREMVNAILDIENGEIGNRLLSRSFRYKNSLPESECL